ncbi:MAG: glycogen-binding domain-containing protein [Lentisphaerae bacterium]|nr:glycogen-binding domain-containing protein [Lentisphaerota bacterium]
MANKTSLAGKKRVRFELHGEKGNEVYVAGSFNSWDPNKNKLRFKNGVYSTSLLLAKGRYEYKFVVNGNWGIDPACEEWTPNEMGSLNSVITVL